MATRTRPGRGPSRYPRAPADTERFTAIATSHINGRRLTKRNDVYKTDLGSGAAGRAATEEVDAVVREQGEPDGQAWRLQADPAQPLAGGADGRWHTGDGSDTLYCPTGYSAAYTKVNNNN